MEKSPYLHILSKINQRQAALKSWHKSPVPGSGSEGCEDKHSPTGRVLNFSWQVSAPRIKDGAY